MKNKCHLNAFILAKGFCLHCRIGFYIIVKFIFTPVCFTFLGFFTLLVVTHTHTHTLPSLGIFHIIGFNTHTHTCCYYFLFWLWLRCARFTLLRDGGLHEDIFSTNSLSCLLFVALQHYSIWQLNG